MLTDSTDRADLVGIASSITTDRPNSEAVLGTAKHLAAWVEAAATKTDLVARMDALAQHRNNNRVDGGGYRDEVMDDPDGFLKGAEVLYCFIVANEPDGDGAGALPDTGLDWAEL